MDPIVQIIGTMVAADFKKVTGHELPEERNERTLAIAMDTLTMHHKTQAHINAMATEPKELQLASFENMREQLAEAKPWNLKMADEHIENEKERGVVKFITVEIFAAIEDLLKTAEIRAVAL